MQPSQECGEPEKGEKRLHPQRNCKTARRGGHGLGVCAVYWLLDMLEQQDTGLDKGNFTDLGAFSRDLGFHALART